MRGRLSRHLRRWLDRLVLDPPDRLRRARVGGLLLPPPSLRRWVGAEDFVAEGRWFVAELARRGALVGGMRVLDLGCGSGRLALALAATSELAPSLYRGFDVDARCIGWCRRRIARHRPAFGFYRADLRSSSYNPRGREDPALFRFPHEDGTFDLVVAASLFTHLLPAAADRFLAESARVLRSGGNLYLTAFLRSAVADPSRHPVTFAPAVVDGEPLSIHDPGRPEAAVALDEERLLEQALESGLVLVGEIAYGMQDHLMLRRR
jgi:SAM-dependent methyltransferase